MSDEIINEIRTNLEWLSVNKKSSNITNISIVLNDLSIQSVTLGELKADAFDLMSRTEDRYKDACAAFVSGYTGTAAKGEREAEVLYKKEKEDWTSAKIMYKKLDIWLDRLDKVLDAHKQRVSVEKQVGLKHM